MNTFIEETMKKFNQYFVGLNIHPNEYKDLEQYVRQSLEECWKKAREEENNKWVESEYK